LKMLKGKLRQLAAAEAATQQHRKNRPIPLLRSIMSDALFQINYQESGLRNEAEQSRTWKL